MKMLSLIMKQGLDGEQANTSDHSDRERDTAFVPVEEPYLLAILEMQVLKSPTYKWVEGGSNQGLPRLTDQMGYRFSL